MVALFFSALPSGTYNVRGKLLEKNRWEVPAAWKAVVKNSQVVEWHVFADNYKTAKILERKRTLDLR